MNPRQSSQRNPPSEPVTNCDHLPMAPSAPPDPSGSATDHGLLITDDWPQTTVLCPLSTAYGHRPGYTYPMTPPALQGRHIPRDNNPASLRANLKGLGFK